MGGPSVGAGALLDDAHALKFVPGGADAGYW